MIARNSRLRVFCFNDIIFLMYLHKNILIDNILVTEGCTHLRHSLE